MLYKKLHYVLNLIGQVVKLRNFRNCATWFNIWTCRNSKRKQSINLLTFVEKTNSNINIWGNAIS